MRAHRRRCAAVFRAVARALPLLFSGRLLGRLVLWTAGAFLLWIVIGAVLYDPISNALAELMGGVGVGVRVAGALIALMIFAFGGIVTAAGPRRDARDAGDRARGCGSPLSDLERRNGGRWHGSLRNALFTCSCSFPRGSRRCCCSRCRPST
jgi:hypothetical protein